MKNNFISVIVAVYNSAETLGACLQALAEQDYPPDKFEVILVDNNSTDNSIAIANNFPFKIVPEKKQGPAFARNTGARKAKGNILVITDSDCVPPKNWVAQINKTFQDETVHAVQGRIEAVPRNYVGKLKAIHRKKDRESCRRKKYITYCDTANCAFRRKAFDQAGGFGDFFGRFGASDTHLGFKLNRAGFLVKYIDSIVTYHLEPTSLKVFMRKKRDFGYWRFVWRKREKVLHETNMFLNRFAYGRNTSEEAVKLALCQILFTINYACLYPSVKLLAQLKAEPLYTPLYPLLLNSAINLGAIKAAQESIKKTGQASLSYLERD